MDHELIARAHRLLRDRYVRHRHAVAAALRTHDDRVFIEHDLRQALTTQFPDGDFTETIRTEALIASRP